MQRLFLAHRADAAGHALAARLVAEERRDAAQQIAQVDGVVDHHDDAGPERGVGRARVFVRQLDVELVGPDERAGGAAEQDGAKRPSCANAARHFDQRRAASMPNGAS